MKTGGNERRCMHKGGTVSVEERVYSMEKRGERACLPVTIGNERGLSLREA
jgi:hypothetical protein